VKRAVDVVGALVGLLVLSPLLAGIALLIRLDAPGAVFYRQERMGREGRIVTILKFRTMYTDADQKLAEILDQDPTLRQEYEQYHKLQDDPRVTRIGQVLRRYSLDELPQILNVLRGDMSLVGPRAYMPSELEKMNGLARAVLQSPPGMTGLWQVSGRNRLSFVDRVNLDVHYIQNWSLWLDLYLLVRTGPVVFSGEGAS
jgi:Undecaprenyl-phosphate galactose phosphotransferase WbaP